MDAESEFAETGQSVDSRDARPFFSGDLIDTANTLRTRPPIAYDPQTGLTYTPVPPATDFGLISQLSNFVDSMLGYVATLLKSQGDYQSPAGGTTAADNSTCSGADFLDLMNIMDGGSSNDSEADGYLSPLNFATTAATAATAATPSESATGATSSGEVSTRAANLPVDGTRPPNSIDVRDFGAKGDGIADDQAAIQHAFDAARSSGQTVWIPAGTYNHGGVLTADGIKVAGVGENSIMRATNPNQSAIRLTGSNGSISNLATQVSAPNRSSMPDAAAILVQNASGATVSGVSVRGASSNGIRLDGALNCTMANNLVMGTNADGIALMNGSCNNLIDHNAVYQAGDDAYSDDSYLGDRRQDEGNVFRNDLAYGNKYGRGFALMGSRNDTIENCIAYGTPGHGIAAGTDSSSDTMTGSGHVIRNNKVIDTRDTPYAIDGMNASGNATGGGVPNIADWTSLTVIDRSRINSSYMPGTGPGANNTSGNRT